MKAVKAEIEDLQYHVMRVRQALVCATRTMRDDVDPHEVIAGQDLAFRQIEDLKRIEERLDRLSVSMARPKRAAAKVVELRPGN
jgi:hypothetical protein